MFYILFSKGRKGGGKEWEWVDMKDMNEDQYSGHLCESMIFLATSLQEGIPTSVLEAMSSGCLVIGYSGIGGNDYMTENGDNQNCFLVENGNLPELVKTLEEVLLGWNQSADRRDLIIKNAVETAKQFHDFDKEGRCLKKYFENIAIKQNSS